MSAASLSVRGSRSAPSGSFSVKPELSPRLRGLCEAGAAPTVTAKPRSQQALNFQLGLDLRIEPDLSVGEAG